VAGAATAANKRSIPGGQTPAWQAGGQAVGTAREFRASRRDFEAYRQTARQPD